ncbi:hypothetical protein STENM36S_07779 [Streptomyces tendae]
MPGKQPPAATLYEAEEARLTGKAGINTDHAGYSGSGFVDRYATEGKATTTFDVTVPKAGTYDVGLRYSNGPNPFEGTKSLSLYADGKKVRQTQLPSTGDWGHLVHPDRVTAGARAPDTTRSPTATTPATPGTSTST